MPLDEIRILQVGEENWSEKYRLPEGVSLYYTSRVSEYVDKPYDIVFLDRTLWQEELDYLDRAAKAYTLFVTEKVSISDDMQWFYDSKQAQRLDTEQVQQFLLHEVKFYYAKPYGEKFRFSNVAVSRDFPGTVKWNGNYDVTLEGEFGEQFSQAAYWRNNLLQRKEQVIDLWLEYDKSADVSICLVVTQFAANGSIGNILSRLEFGEKELERVIRLESDGDVFNFFSIFAKGSGQLRIIALHDRHSRGEHGYFLPGGERHVTSDREELFCYFEPRDRKPPLNVFFSGWELTENFQGYSLNRNLGCPFLLLTEHRLMGGGFYVGSKEYEEMVLAVIKKYMDELGFASDQVILSGLSMGAYGAVYYGCDIKPHAMILMKPLAGIGNVAANEKHFRPGGYPTSLDVLRYLGGSLDADAVAKVNDKFWNKFDSADWGESKFIISYMIEDDFECGVYEEIISHLRSVGVQVYGKGIHGRHGDARAATAEWFSRQCKKMLEEDFRKRRTVKNGL